VRLGLILGDQLSLDLPTLAALDPATDRLVMAEVAEEARYVPHHRQKIAFLFSAMRHFARELAQRGWEVAYYPFGEHPHHSLWEALAAEVDARGAAEVVVTHAGEYRLQTQITGLWPARLGVPVTCLEDSRFLCGRGDFAAWARGRKQLRMEYFYREMRRRTGLLMDGGQPVGGAWNLDASNRQPYRGQVPIPPLPRFARDAIDAEVLALVAREFADHPGRLDDFAWATTRADALLALDHFIHHRLAHFGDYQDAMVSGEDWLFHSALSPYLNCGLLAPAEVCAAAEAAFRAGRAPLNAVEGFIRQIIGWREYVRGIYWLHMPAYAAGNALGNRRPLPGFYWSGDTAMHCVKEALRNTFDHGYAHHIQRLMVTGNFALLAGVIPEEICAWYLAVYADAYDWVELPNTLGMVMHADGGYLGSKPYAAPGNYIHKMSDHCRHCAYNVKTASDADSCPFNSLYWHFIARHRARFAANPRMAMIYRTLDKMPLARREAVLARAEALLDDLESL